MASIKMRLLVFVIIASVTAQGNAQQKIKIACKRYTIPEFIANTVSPPKYLDGFRYAKPIIHSQFPLEIRFFTLNIVPQETSILTLKGNKDTLILEREVISHIPSSKYAVKIMVRNKAFYVLRYHPDDPNAAENLLVDLIRDGLFVQTDQHEVLKGWKLKGIMVKPSEPIMDCCADGYIEIKVNNRLRSFTYNADPATANDNIKELNRGGIIEQDFYSAYKILKLVTDAESDY